MDLASTVKRSIEQYFINLDGADANNLYELMLSQVERPLLEAIMLQAQNNQSLAARWLGVSRNTLRKLLAKYNLG